MGHLGHGRSAGGSERYPAFSVAVTADRQTPYTMSRHGNDPVPSGIWLDLDEAFRVLEALEDSLLALEEAGLAPGLRDELATVIRLVHDRLGLDEGGLK